MALALWLAEKTVSWRSLEGQVDRLDKEAVGWCNGGGNLPAASLLVAVSHHHEQKLHERPRAVQCHVLPAASTFAAVSLIP